MDDVNHWLEDRCAVAFWDQYKAAPYQQLLQDTIRWAEPGPGQRWLDLGCGSGQLTAALWQKSHGQIGSIVAADCAAINQQAIERLQRRLNPPPLPGQIEFRRVNFSDGLFEFETASFDGILSGLAISYAEHRDPQTGQYTDRAYNQLYQEMRRVLKPGGQLVFSVNVPDPDFWKVFWRSLGPGVRVGKPLRALWNGLRMMRYGTWLRREARRGRFHFLSLSAITERLCAAGFEELRYRLSYAGQAYVVAAKVPAMAMVKAA